MNTPSLLRRGLLTALATAVVLSGIGCENISRKQGRSSSVVSYLYPKDDTPSVDQSIPVLNLPLRVGVAFVPPNNGARGNYSFDPEGLSEMQKNMLMQKVREAFKAYPFVQSIEIVPSSYLRPAGSFENLDQLRRMLGIDVVVLLAYDQVQFTNENFLSLAYWTIVGAYVVEGNKNDTQTIMEAAVYDIPSRHLLFRAPGTSQVKGSSTAISTTRELREASAKSFDEAIKDVIKNLDTQLAEFRERVKNAPGEVRIVNKPGYSGGGSFEWTFAAVLGCLALAFLCRRKTK